MVRLTPIQVGSEFEGTLAVMGSLEPIARARRDYILSVLVLSVVGISLILGIGYFLARSINTPIKVLLSGIRRVEDGDLEVTIAPDGRDEITQLTVSFNRMVARLRDEMLVIRQSLGDAKAASEARERFVVTVSHELRTPLSVIIGYVSLMRDGTIGEAPPAFMQTLEVVERRAEELYRLIENVLLVSRVDRGETIAPRLGGVAVDELVADVAEELAPTAREKGVRLTVEGAFGSSPFQTDGDLVHEILLNLVANAVKFTPAGGLVKVAVAASGGLDLPSLELSVEDTGIGIPAEHLGSIFQPFYQVDSSYQRSHGGTGIGLYIVKEMVRILGGSVEVTSAAGKGSRFTVVVPGTVTGS